MATSTARWYGPGILAMMNKEVDLNTDDLRMFFTTSSHTPDYDTHDYLNDLTSTLINGTNVPNTGIALTTEAIAVVGASDRVKFTHDDVVVANATATDYAPGTDATRPILIGGTFDTTLNPNAATLTIDVDNTNGTGYFAY
jgi:hypothetical protein